MSRSGYDFSGIVPWMPLKWDDGDAGFNATLERNLNATAAALAADNSPMSEDEVADLRDEAIKYRKRFFTEGARP